MSKPATATLSLSPDEWMQKSAAEWFAGVTIPLNARVDLQLSSGSASGYASRIDNGTGDAVVLPLMPAVLTTVNTSPQISGCAVFPADNPWNRDISNDPVDPNSNNYIANMNGATKFLHPDFGSNLTYGIPYVVVAGTQPKVPVTFDYDEDSDPGPYPIPPDAPIEGGRTRPATGTFWCSNETIAYSTKRGILDSSARAGTAGRAQSSIFDPTNFGQTPGPRQTRPDCRFFRDWFAMTKPSPPGRSGMLCVSRCNPRNGPSSIPPRTTPAATPIQTRRPWV